MKMGCIQFPPGLSRAGIRRPLAIFLALAAVEMPPRALAQAGFDGDGDGVADTSDNCPYFANPAQSDVDQNGRGGDCECGDQDGNGRVNVADLIAINAAIFRPAQATPLCDATNDGRCDVADIVGANRTIFTPKTSTCARQPVPGPGSTLWIDDISVAEGDAGTTTAVFRLSRSEPSASATTVAYAAANGSATAPADYLAASGTARIESGETFTDIGVTINGDTLGEPDESFSVRLSNPVNALIADAEGIADILDDDVGPPTSLELVARALEAGEIDAETALVYQVFAEFEDPRLPAPYQGAAEQHFEGSAIREAARRFDSLAAPIQAVLAPFLAFPDLFALDVGSSASVTAPPGSGAASRVATAQPAEAASSSFDFTAIDLVPGVIRMGWDQNSPLAFALQQTANRLKAAFDARIYPRLRTFLGAPTGGRILILLADGPGTSFEKVSADCTTAYITLHDFEPHVLAHELTHALLDINFAIAACNDSEKLWMHEATATWAQHYVYPPTNEGREQNTAPFFLREPDRSLFAYDGSARGHEYGAYLWFFRLAGQGSNPGIVRAIWEAGAGASSLEAIESALNSSGFGGFQDQWPRFAVDNWNRHPPHRKYHDWDRLDHKAAQAEYTADLQGAGFQNLQLGFDLPRLSASYQRWDFTGDPGIRTILFRNEDAGNRPSVSIHAIAKIRNQGWRSAEDWSNETEKSFCRDNASEDLEELVLVITNRGWQASDPERVQDDGALSLYYSGLPCSDWTGTTDYRSERSAGDAVEITRATGTGLRFRVLPENRGLWRAIAGTVNVSYDTTFPFEDGTCTGTGGTQFVADQHAQFLLFPLASGFEFAGGDIAFLPNPPTLQVTFHCSSSSGTFTFVQDQPWFGTPWFFTGPPRPFDPGDTTIQGTHASDDDEWSWSFAKDQ